MDSDVPQGTSGARTGYLIDYWHNNRWLTIAVTAADFAAYNTILTNALSQLRDAGVASATGSAAIATGAAIVGHVPVAASVGAIIAGSGACATGANRARTAFSWFNGLLPLVDHEYIPINGDDSVPLYIQDVFEWTANSLAEYLQDMGFNNTLVTYQQRRLTGFTYNYGGDSNCNYCDPDNVDQ